MNFDEEIKHCSNMKQILVVVERYYNLEKPLGIATKIIVQVGIKKILTVIKAEKK
jgi:hypothetical protein